MEILFISADVAQMLKGKTYGENLYFNPVQDENGRWFISQEEVNGFFAKHPIPEPVLKDEVASWTIKAVLEAYYGITDEVIYNLIDTLDEPIKTMAKHAWKDAKTFDKYSPLIITFAQRLSLDTELVWAQARQINI